MYVQCLTITYIYMLLFSYHVFIFPPQIEHHSFSSFSIDLLNQDCMSVILKVNETLSMQYNAVHLLYTLSDNSSISWLLIRLRTAWVNS